MVEDHLTEAQFRRVASLVENHTGIRVPASKRIMVEARLRKRVRALGLADLSAYAALLAGDGAEAEFPHFIDCMTTNKTDFFREPVHFDVLRDRIVPDLLRRDPQRQLTLWSAACSTGAEPYTMAMVMMRSGARRRFATGSSPPTSPPTCSPRPGAPCFRSTWRPRSRPTCASATC